MDTGSATTCTSATMSDIVVCTEVTIAAMVVVVVELDLFVDADGD